MYKAGTVAELQERRPPVPDEVYQKALDIVTMLDENFGKNRDVECDEGGFVFIALNQADLDYFKREYFDLEEGIFEYGDFINTKEGDYLYIFCFYGYDYGTNIFMPVSIAPEVVKQGILKEVVQMI